MLKLDANAVIWSTPESQRAGRPLLVLLHGYGSHEGDLFGMAPYFPLDFTIASVRAPHAEGNGFAWFAPDARRPGDPQAEGVDDATDALLDWLAEVRGDAPVVGLLGFSQGGAVAVHALRRDPDSAAFAVNLGGFTVGGEQSGDAELARRLPPVFWGRGLLDQVIPASAIERTEGYLPDHVDLTTGIYEDLGHGVSQTELADVVRFLRERVA